MDLTPNDIRNQAFSSSFRGYAKEEVGAFKEAVATALDEARVQVQKLTQELDSVSQRYNEIKGLEETVKSAVIEAQKNSEQIVANARKEAELIVNEAKQRRDQSIEAKHLKMSELEAKINELKFSKQSLYTKLRGEIQAHLKLVDSIYPETKPTKDYTPEPPKAVKKPLQDTQPVKPPSVEPPSVEAPPMENPQVEAPPVKDPTVEASPMENPQVEEQVKDPMGGEPPMENDPPVEMSPLKDEHPTDEESTRDFEPPVNKWDEKETRPEQKDKPSLDFNDSDIDSLVDGLQEEAEEVKNGQTQGSDI